MRSFNNILVTGGAGFIGSHVVRRLINKYPETNIVNLDLLTYAGNLENISDIEHSKNYAFVKGDICDRALLRNLFKKHNFDAVVHLAAESHVDRSISNPGAFLETNILGTAALLEAAKSHWIDKNGAVKNADTGTTNHTLKNVFYHISTDEVYGSLGEEGLFSETTSYNPRSPYSASKASSDHIVRAYHHTYGLPVVISNCSNNYGPNQFPEKLVPLLIIKAIQKQPLPLYGNGKQTRSFLYVDECVEGIIRLMKSEFIGPVNIGSDEMVTINQLVDIVSGIANNMLQIRTGRCPNEATWKQICRSFVK